MKSSKIMTNKTLREYNNLSIKEMLLWVKL